MKDESMNKHKGETDHLIKNLERISSENSIFNYEIGRNAFLSLGEGDIHDWLEKLLPNTRLVLEPKIVGSCVGIQYINGKLNKVINDISADITEEVKSQRCIPKILPIKKRIEIMGILYKHKNSFGENKNNKLLKINYYPSKRKFLKFCAFQIFHCKINHFQALRELKQLNFEVPQTQFTKYISDIDIYRQCWKEGKLFQSYPTNGIVLKINSRKLQKHLGENNRSVNWAYSIN